jgi:2-oxoglutarate dehydrogenase E1 component
MEQLYPLPKDELLALLSAYREAGEVVWAQEEPANQGPWPYIALNLPELLDERALRVASRPAAAAPAAGSVTRHDAEQAQLLDAVFG